MTRAEILNCLTDRPCDVCQFYESGRCERWDCVFEEKPDDVEADAISRISVLDTLDNTDEFMDEERTVENYKALLKECYEVLPSVTPKQKMGHWIPVSERLPEVKYDSLGNNISDYVLLWVKKGDYETYKVGYFSPPNCFDAITSDGWFISICALKDVIAWMPLPEPYKGGEGE